MYLRNAWYVAGWGSEVERAPFERTILNEPIVMYRTQAGTVVALEDRCCHRSLPLSMGKVIGDELQCGYHGLTFDAGGTCVHVPGQSQIPPGAQIKSYPVTEKWGWIWLWMGGADAG